MMKHVAFTLAALALGAVPAFAASASGTPIGNRMTNALNLLEAHGYGSFSDFKANGNDFTATVNKNGRDVTVQIDPGSGQITTQS